LADEAIKTLAVAVALNDSSFQTGMKNLKSQMGVISSEFQSSVAGLKNWGSNLDSLKDKAQSLGEKINVQKQIVQAYQEQLNKSKVALSENSQKMADLKSKVASASTDYQNNIQTVSNLKEKVTLLNSAYKNSVMETGKDSDATKALREQLNQAKQAYSTANESIGKNSEATKNLKSNLEALEKQYSSSEKVVAGNSTTINGYTTQVNNAKGKLKEFESELSSTNSKIRSMPWEEMGQKIADAGEKAKQFSDKLSSLGQTLTATLTTAVSSAGIAVAKLAGDFEDGMAKIATVADTSEISLDKMSEGILNVSNTTNQSATDIQDALYDAISAGIDTGNSLTFIESAAELAKAGFSDVSTAADGLTSVLNAYGLKATETANISNQMMVAQNIGKTTIDQIAQSISQVTPTAANLNVATQDLFASLGSLTANGISTSESVTGLKAAFSNILQPTTEATKQAAELGLNFSAAALQTEGWSGFLTELKEKTKGNSQELSNLFGSTQALNTVMALTSDQGMSTFSEALKEMSGNTDYVGQAFDTVSSTPAQQLKASLNDVKNMAITFGDKLNSSVLPPLNTLKGYADELYQKVQKLTGAQASTITQFAGFAAAAGPALLAIGKIGTGLGTMQSGFGNGIKKVTEFASTSKTKFGEITQTVSQFNTKVGNLGGVQKLGSLFSGLDTKIQAALNPAKTALSGFKTKITDAFGNTTTSLFKKLPTGLQTALTSFQGELSTEAPKLKSVLGTIGGGITSGLQSVVTSSLKLFAPAVLVAAILVGLGAADTQMGGKLDEMIQTVTAKGPALITKFIEGITSKIPLLIETGAAVLTDLIDAITANGPYIIEGAVKILTSLVDGLSNNLGKLIPAALDCVTALANSLIDNLPLILQSGLKLLVALVEGITSDPQKLVNTIVSLVTSISEVIIENLPTIIEAAIQIMVALIKGLAEAIPQLIAALPQIISAIWDGLSSVDWPKLGLEILEGIGQGLLEIGKGILGSIKSAGEAIVKGFKDFFGIHSPSTVARDEIGYYIGLGITEGLRKATLDTVGSAASSYMTTLASGIKGGQSKVTAVITTVASQINSSLKSSLTKISSTVSSNYDTLVSNIESRLTTLKSDIQDVVDDYNEKVSELQETIYNSTSLFDDVSTSDSVTGDSLTSNLQGQVDQLEAWQTALESLKSKNISSALLSELEAMGPSATADLQALNSLTSEQLDNYVSLWEEKTALSKEAAENELTEEKAEAEAQVKELETEAAADIKTYVDAWSEGTDTVESQLSSLAENAGTWGSDLIQGLIDGMNSQKTALYNAASDLAFTISSQLHFSRPDVGPLVDYESWMPDMVEGMAEGVTENKYKLSDAIQSLTQSISTGINGSTGTVSQTDSTSTAADTVQAALQGGDVNINHNYYVKTATASEIARNDKNTLRRLSFGLS
jgi:TP901 family phage tail tape measure protein